MARAKQATTRTARFLSRCVVVLCKGAVAAHATAAVITIALLSLSQHHVTSKPVAQCLKESFGESALNYVQYAHTHMVVPWVILVVCSCFVQALQALMCCLTRAKNIMCVCLTKRKKTPVKYPPKEKTLDTPPQSTRDTPTYSRKTQKQRRLYPTIESFKLLRST